MPGCAYLSASACQPELAPRARPHHHQRPTSPSLPHCQLHSTSHGDYSRFLRHCISRLLSCSQHAILLRPPKLIFFGCFHSPSSSVFPPRCEASTPSSRTIRHSTYPPPWLPIREPNPAQDRERARPSRSYLLSLLEEEIACTSREIVIPRPSRCLIPSCHLTKRSSRFTCAQSSTNYY